MTGPLLPNDSAAARTWTVRAAVVSDAAPLSALGARTFVDTYLDGHDAADVRLYVATHFTELVQREEIADPGRRTLLAVDGEGAIGGYAQIERRPPPPGVGGERPVLLARLYLDRAHHGTGLGALLFDAAVAEARRTWGADVLWLSIWQRNDRARRFYLRRGMREVGTIEFTMGTEVATDPVFALAL